MNRRSFLVGATCACTARVPGLASLATLADHAAGLAPALGTLGLQRTAAAGIETRWQSAERGCSLTGAASQAAVAGRTTSQSGDPRLDTALIAEVKQIDAFFGIQPAYQYLDDGVRPNAYANDTNTRPGTQGTISIGLTLLGLEFQEPWGGAAVAGIAAHEGAHIFQFTTRYYAACRQLSLMGNGTDREMELHADFLAGFYFAGTGRTAKSLDVFGRSLFKKGDKGYNNPWHHGTPQERLTAMATGYAVWRRTDDLITAANEGLAHVRPT